MAFGLCGAEPAAAVEAAVKPLVALARIGKFVHPVLVAAPPGDRQRLVVVQQDGLVHLLERGVRKAAPFLDLRPIVREGAEQGLLGLAFAPDYAESGLFYVLYNDLEGDLQLVERQRSATDASRADPVSERAVLTVDTFSREHNGGMLQFGADGLLYVGIGDGGQDELHPPGHFAQQPDSPFGKILRLDPRATVLATPEVFASGLRNPWRFWIDAPTGDLFVGDVGEDEREEIDFVPAAASGLDFGWPCFEGRVPFDPASECPDAIAPLVDFPHGRRVCAVIGGVVVRDPRLRSLRGAYLFGDSCSPSVRTLRLRRGQPVLGALGVKVLNPVSFGVDGLGRVYVTSYRGDVYRLDPRR